MILGDPSRSRDRYSFANLDEALELPDLIAIQRETFEWFLNQGLAETFRDISPIKDFTETLQLELEFDPDDEDLRPPPKFTVEECKEKDMTFSAPIFVRARFMNGNTGEIKEQTVFMGDFPMMTDKGTFVINGTERVVVSQLVRSPGVIFQPGERFRLRNLAKHQLVTGTIHPYRGEWIEFDVEQKPGKDVTAGTRVARKRRLGIFVLLRALGYDEENAPGFLDALRPPLRLPRGPVGEGPRPRPHPGRGAGRDLQAGPSGRAAVGRVGQGLLPQRVLRDPPLRPQPRSVATSSNRKLGPELDKLEELFGLDVECSLDDRRRAAARPPEPGQPVLSRCEVLAACTYLLHLVKQRAGLPPRRPGPLRQPPHPLGRRADPEPGPHRPVPHGAGRPRAHDHPGRRGHHAPDAHQHPARWSPPSRSSSAPASCPSSWTRSTRCRASPTAVACRRSARVACRRERAGFEVRDVHFSHYGRMCPIETPEGPNIGLIGALATYARVNEFGFIESPYRKVINGKVTDEIVYLAADEEEEYVVAQANAPLNADGTLRRRARARAPLAAGRHRSRTCSSSSSATSSSAPPPRSARCRRPRSSSWTSRRSRSSRSATALIPFLEHDDANRALMGANMQKQAVPLVRAEAPYIGTGIEARAARDAADMIIADDDGVVTEVDGTRITVEYKTRGQRRSTGCSSSSGRTRTPASTRSRVVAEGDKVNEGRHPRRRPLHRQRRARPRQEPPRRLHAVGGLQLRGRHHPLASAW